MIGSQAAIAEPRATVPSPTAAGAGAGRWSATPTTVADRPSSSRRAERPDRRLGRGQPEPVDELGLLVGAQEEVDRRVAAAEAGPVGLADRAAGQHDPHPRVRRLEPRQLAHPADDLLLGALADRAGVDDDEVGGLERGGLVAAGGQQAAGHLLGVAPVHLAAERPDMEARQGPRVGQVLGEPVVVGRAGWRGAARRRGGDELEHRAACGWGVGSVGHGCAGEPTTEPGRADADGHLGRDPQPGVRLGVGARVAVVVAARRSATRPSAGATAPTARPSPTSNER